MSGKKILAHIDTPVFVKNKGSKAGGANTNYYGKKFEEKTDNEIMLKNDNYLIEHINKNYYLYKNIDTKNTVFVKQQGLKSYIKKKYDIELFRNPDEAYIIDNNDGKIIIKILEKKEQRVSGSVETKLWASPSLKREYELMMGGGFEIHYCLCINSYLQKLLTSKNKKYMILNQILKENGINVLFGDDDNYLEMLNNWINY